MKKLMIVALLLSIAAGCSRPQDKKAELAALIAERDKLTEKIAALQQELATSDTGSASLGKVKTVIVTELQPGPFNHYIEIQGKVDGDENIGVNPKIPGVVSRIAVKVGDHVTKGQTLIELDAEVTRKTLHTLNEQLSFVTTLYNKQKNLWDQKIGSEVDYLRMKNEKESLQNKIDELEESLEMARITSPINGTVEGIPVKVGSSVSPGFAAIRVINFSKIKVVAELAESYSTRVNPGDAVRIYFPDYRTEVEARVSFVSKYINPVNRTFEVEAHLNSPDLNFKANMIAVMKINDYSVGEAFSVPVNIIQKSQDGAFVYVARKEEGKPRARRQLVTVGTVYNGLAEVRSGLTTGDKVITMGYQDLYDGQGISF